MAAAAREPAHPLDRLVSFSDAVFAIAITLLVIEIDVPQLPRGAGDIAQIAALASRFPHFVGYFVTFAVVGAFWAEHHRAFRLASHYAPGLLWPNMVLLCAIAFMPFVAAYMSENYGSRVPHALYNGVLLATALLNLRLARRVTGAPYVDEGASAEDVAVTRARPWGVIGGAALALLVSFVAPLWSQIALVTIPLWMTLAIRRARGRVGA